MFIALLCGLVLALILGFPLAACADEVEIRWWKASHGATPGDWRTLIDEFERERPGVKVQVVHHSWANWDERYTSAFIGATPPDVSYMPDEFWPRYAASGHLARLDELFPEEVAAMEAEYPANFWQLGRLSGHQYGIPYIFVSYQICINKDLFDQAGIAYPPADPSDPGFADWTWARFMAVAKALTRDLDGDGVVDQHGLAWTSLEANPNTVYPFLWQAGADIIDVARNTNGFAERGVAGLQFIRDLIDAGVIAGDGLFPSSNEIWLTPFYEGKVAMALVGSASVIRIGEDFPELNVRFALTPQGPGVDFYEGRGTFGNAGFWVIAEASEHKREAFELARFLNRRENLEHMMNITKLFGARSDWRPPGDEPLLQTFMTGRRYLVPYPLHPQLRQTHSLVLAQIQDMVLGEVTPEEAIAIAAERVDALLDSH
jgi:multiple sugar transport system substrate-binding protein